MQIKEKKKTCLVFKLNISLCTETHSRWKKKFPIRGGNSLIKQSYTILMHFYKSVQQKYDDKLEDILSGHYMQHRMQNKK